MSDRIVRAITSDGMVQAAAISSRGLTERARQIHKTLPVATAALTHPGRLRHDGQCPQGAGRQPDPAN